MIDYNAKLSERGTMTTQGDNNQKGKTKKSPIPGAKQFTSEYQPDPKKQSEGQKRYWQYRKARQQMFEKLCDVKLPNGKGADFWDAVKEKLTDMVFAEDIDLSDYESSCAPNGAETLTFLGNKLTAREKSDLILKLCKEFMPEDKTVKLENGDGGPFVINFIEQSND